MRTPSDVGLMHRVPTIVASCLLLAEFGLCPAHSQGMFVHPRSFGSSDFEQPLAAIGYRWRGPSIRQFHVQCWHREPTAPATPVGGTNDVQKVQLFVPTDDLGANNPVA